MCEVYQSEMRVKINRQVYVYPDIVVVCGQGQFEGKSQNMLLNPTVIIEVQSPSTEEYDQTDKFYYYRTLASLQEYVLIAQDKYRVRHVVRQPDNYWGTKDYDGLDAVVELPSIGCTLPLAEVYRKVTLDDSPSNFSPEK
jgi:Uma2 family endonuclease